MSSLVRRSPRWCVWVLPVAWAVPALAQFGGGAPPPPANPRAAAPVDVTGYWVSIVTEDWRYRMLTPDKGDFLGIPLNAAGQRVLASWDPVKDTASGNQCRSYGAAAIMRVPTRLHIEWQEDNLLRVETDAGKQTRLLHFGETPPAGGEPSLQGYSVASWQGLRPRPAFGVTSTLATKREPEGYLKVMTSQLQPGYLRKNGVPYSAKAQVEEYFDTFREPNGDSWLIVTTVVTDPEYLDGNFITSSQFKKLPGPTGWNPRPCEAQ